MRSIKFRGKRIDNGEWVYGGFMQTPEATFVVDYSVVVQKARDGYPTVYDVVEVDPETVGQFVCKDKKGQDVFAGSKSIKHDLYHDQLGEVVWCENDLRWEVFFPLTKHRAHIRLNKQLEKAENIELIGGD